MRKYIKVSECPPLLAELIDLVNLIPTDVELPEIEFSEYLKISSEDLPEFDDFPVTDISFLPAELIVYLEKSASKFLDNYDNMGEARKNLFREANYYNDYKEFRSIRNDLLYIAGKHAPKDSFFLESRTMVYTTNKGTFEILPSKLLEAIYGVERRRIRICDFCKKIYWAKRLDAQTCGNKRCSDVLSARKYQSRNKAEINRKRRTNYEQIKKLKEIKEKKNVTF
jgi:hypothetical protein